MSILKSLEAIQSKHNFDPSGGVKQIHGQSTQVCVTYGRFCELVRQARKLGVEIPYDPTGQAPLAHIKEPRTWVVYLARAVGEKDVFKIGYSHEPYIRVGKGLQGGNHEVLTVVATTQKFPTEAEARKAETRLLAKYKKFRARRSKEWFRFPEEMRALVKSAVTKWSNVILKSERTV